MLPARILPDARKHGFKKDHCVEALWSVRRHVAQSHPSGGWQPVLLTEYARLHNSLVEQPQNADCCTSSDQMSCSTGEMIGQILFATRRPPSIGRHLKPAAIVPR